MSNMMKGGGLLALSGMAAASVVNHVQIWRPMLPHSKDDVYACAHAARHLLPPPAPPPLTPPPQTTATTTSTTNSTPATPFSSPPRSYAHTYGVPYFKDSTPQWSTRGKLRGKLLPLLEEVYGDGFANHLSGLACARNETSRTPGRTRGLARLRPGAHVLEDPCGGAGVSQTTAARCSSRRSSRRSSPRWPSRRSRCGSTPQHGRTCVRRAGPRTPRGVAGTRPRCGSPASERPVPAQRPSSGGMRCGACARASWASG